MPVCLWHVVAGMLSRPFLGAAGSERHVQQEPASLHPHATLREGQQSSRDATGGVDRTTRGKRTTRRRACGFCQGVGQTTVHPRVPWGCQHAGPPLPGTSTHHSGPVPTQESVWRCSAILRCPHRPGLPPCGLSCDAGSDVCLTSGMAARLAACLSGASSLQAWPLSSGQRAAGAVRSTAAGKQPPDVERRCRFVRPGFGPDSCSTHMLARLD